ncbi:Protein affecting phage T7 exclusion by the F plasmid, UPF0716 family [Halopseudomonas xinjiangensis]|uniref:Protein affecting phage T7 exclusion by the F plasmid, UPF0716 family n=1 Tax=Halopseudomonas xinjiangensis TaxID=487184 RepID=A0A1H1USJ0_9GAMM|nr:FxsA family protein [Halopseudomonas xinjiangensis]SDS75086.1 Protein affecting phage T7 exclusion by the F plasmid, UPF0716 family [Halopseudomonas xinjiangensis]
MIRLLLIAVPLIELAGLIMLGQRVGVGYTLLWVLVSGLLGVAVIQRQGWGTLQRLQERLADNRSPFSVLKSGMWGVVAGLLLMFPGVITDALAVAALIVALRHRGQPEPGEPGGPRVYRRGDNNIIEGEWESPQGSERRDDPDSRIDKH